MGRLSVYVMSRLFTKDEMEEMESTIASFLNSKKIALTPPVDIFRFATLLNFDVRAARFQGALEGILLVDESKKIISDFRSSKVIVYSVESDLMKNKFVVAHELAHYIDEKMKHGNHDAEIVIAARDPNGSNYSNNDDEQRKDYMAAALLIPKDHLLNILQKFKSVLDKLDDKFYQTLADYYRVDVPLAKRRVKEVSEWIKDSAQMVRA